MRYNILSGHIVAHPQAGEVTIEGYLSTAEVAERFGTTERSARRWCEHGLLKGAQRIGIGRRATWMVPDQALEGFSPPKPGPKPRGPEASRPHD